MRHPRHRTRRASALAVFLAATLALIVLFLPGGAAPALAKEGLLVAFDGPIAFDTPPGTDLLVGMTVTALDEDGERPVFGSPILLILTGRDGTETEAHGVEDAAGHYVMRIAVPPGGARDARVVMRGMGSDGPVDIELVLTTDPFTFGGVTPRTAQVALPPSPMLTPLPRASAVPQAAAASAAPAIEAGLPDAASTTVTAVPADTAEGSSWWPPALGVVALGFAVVIAVRLRLARRPAQGT